MTLRSSARAILAACVVLISPLAGAAEEMTGSIQHLIASARTKADQERIAGIYDAQSLRDRDEAAKHTRLAEYYRSVEPPGGRGGGFGQMALHCTNLAGFYTRSAEENAKLAEMHRKMAAEMK